jgi:hypothetical protein
MSLDFTILDSNGFPKTKVGIGVDTHYKLMRLTDQTEGSLLKRLNDYYADAQFDISQLESLLRELIDLREQCRQEEPLFSVLKDLIALAEAARLEQKPLLVIAD